jgi:hypothetical protein
MMVVMMVRIAWLWIGIWTRWDFWNDARMQNFNRNFEDNIRTGNHIMSAINLLEVKEVLTIS